jgi:hypothetical protein
MSTPTRKEVADLHFMDARAKLLDLAAFLDRVDRSSGSDDHRIRGLRLALKVLSEGNKNRVEEILNQWSDPTVEPSEKSDTKSATGVWPKL